MRRFPALPAMLFPPLHPAWLRLLCLLWHRWLEVFLKLKSQCKDSQAPVPLRGAQGAPLLRELLATVATGQRWLLVPLSSQ